MTANAHTIHEKIWVYPGKSGWHFVTINKETGDIIKADYIWPRRGFGSIPVKVTIGRSNFKTSIFPEKTGSFLLPIKKEIRLKEQISPGDTLTITLSVVN